MRRCVGPIDYSKWQPHLARDRIFSFVRNDGITLCIGKYKIIDISLELPF